MANLELYCCCLCECCVPSFPLYVSHLRLVHRHDQSFSVTCGIDGCNERFETFGGFNSHIYRHHRRAMGVESTTEAEVPEENPDPTFSVTAVSGDLYMQSPDAESTRDLPDVTPGTTGAPVQETSEVSAAKFLLRLREGRQISQVAVSDVIAGCRRICKESVEKLRSDVREKLLQDGSINPETIDAVDDVFCKADSDPFGEIDTNYRFEKFCADYFNYLVCIHACFHIFVSLP